LETNIYTHNPSLSTRLFLLFFNIYVTESCRQNLTKRCQNKVFRGGWLERLLLISDVRPASANRFRKEVETKMTPVQKIINNVTRKLEGVPGIIGVVLGGSRARGTHRPDSDIDIGIYYDES
jgi:hypothetical protein